MTHKINISIPQPCHENWEAMTAVDKGKFCASCQKKVHDFTKASDREIVTAFQQNENICGRFLNSQLDRDLVKPKEKSSIWLASTSAIISFIGIGTHEAIAQGQPIKTEQTDKKVLGDKAIDIKKEEIEVTGIVLDENGIPFPGVSIVVKGTTISTQTDIQGKFTIKAKKEDYLTFYFIGYQSISTIVNSSNVTVQFDESKIDVTVVGGLVRNRTFFGRIFHAIGNLFR